MGGARVARRICGGVALTVTDMASASPRNECPEAEPGSAGILPAPKRALRSCPQVASVEIVVLSGSLERRYA